MPLMLNFVILVIINLKLLLNSAKVLEFVDEHGNEVLNLGSFTLLPQHVVRLILAREELRADEFTKFQVSLTHEYVNIYPTFFCIMFLQINFSLTGCINVE